MNDSAASNACAEPATKGAEPVLKRAEPQYPEPTLPCREPHPIEAFLEAIDPFFHERVISYVDVGAHRGDVFRALLDKGPRIGSALLIEPNPASFEILQSLVEGLKLNGRVRCHNVALGAEPGRLQFQAADDMTRVIGSAREETPSVAGHVFEARATTLDALVGELRKPRINLLKIDVEGFEAEVLAGAKSLLTDQAIDVVYIEAGMSPQSGQQTYYRVIEDALGAYGYRLFKIFEQMHEWPEDSPLLRRVNLAFMSPRFSTAHPYRLCADLLKLRKRTEAVTRDLLVEQEHRRADSAAFDRVRQEAALERTALSERLASESNRLLQSLEEIAHLKAAKAAIEARSAEVEDRAIRVAEQLKNEKKAASTARDELARVWKYAQVLERKYLEIRTSETWRVMEPVRWVMRSLKRRPAPSVFKPKLVGPPPVSQPSRADTVKLRWQEIEARQEDCERPLFGFDAARPRSEKVIVFLATFPARAGNLPHVVRALLPQCDVLSVYLNEYDHVPECLKHDKVHAILGKDAAGNIKDNGKFYLTNRHPDAFHIFVDDDLIYPPDYVKRLVLAIKFFGYNTVVGLHGTIYRPPLQSYLNDRIVLPFYADSRNVLVDQLGTGTIGYHSSMLSIDVNKFETTGMADLWFAKSASEQGVSLIALERPGDWLQPMKEQGDTLFRKMKRDDSTESALLRDRLAPVLRRSPRVRMLNFLRSAYASPHLERVHFEMDLSGSGAFGSPTRQKSDVHFALIVTGWNCETYVHLCLDSIAQQIPGNYTFDIYVYNDGSTDGTAARLRERSGILNMALWEGEENNGPAFARDRLIRQVSDGNDICVLLDMDDRLLPFALARLEQVYRADRRCWMTYGNWINQGGVVNDEGIYTEEEIATRAYRTSDVFKFTHLRSFRRFLYDRVDSVHLKDENGNWLRFCSDVGLMLPIADQCAPENVVALTEPLYLYNQYRPSGTQKRFGMAKKQVFRYLRDNHTLPRREA